MAVDTGNWMRDLLTCLRIGERINFFKALQQISVARLLESGISRGVAVEAGARLRFSLPPGEGLVIEHERMAAFFTKIDGEGITCPHLFQARIFLDLGLRN